MADVFISYSQHDAEIAAAVAQRLEALGYSTWRFQEKSKLGGSYLKRIAAEIRSCRAALFVVSRDSLASTQCEAELVRAHELAKPLLPLRRGITHEELVGASDEWGLALKGAVTAEVALETAAAMADEAASVLREQGIEAGQPPALPTSPLRRLSRGAVHGIAPRDASLGALVAGVVGALGLPFTLASLGKTLSPGRDIESQILLAFPSFRTTTTLVNAAGILQNALLLYGAWLAYRRDPRGGPLLRKVSLSMIVTVSLWLFVALATFTGVPNGSAIVSGAISTAFLPLAASALVFALFRQSGRGSGA